MLKTHSSSATYWATIVKIILSARFLSDGPWYGSLHFPAPLLKKSSSARAPWTVSRRRRLPWCSRWVLPAGLQEPPRHLDRRRPLLPPLPPPPPPLPPSPTPAAIEIYRLWWVSLRFTATTPSLLPPRFLWALTRSISSPDLHLRSRHHHRRLVLPYRCLPGPFKHLHMLFFEVFTYMPL